MKLGVAGITVGHWTDNVARTGCTVIRFPPDTVASGEVRGGAPATREFALLDPTRVVGSVDAVLLTGGSAFGLAAADGVLDVLVAEGRGFATAQGPVPIVVAMALYDLGVGEGAVRPDRDSGRKATEAATTSPAVGRVGAGCGATVGKWRGPDHAIESGIGVSVIRSGALVVSAIVATNAAGDIDDGSVAASLRAGSFTDWPASEEPGTNTTIGAVVTNARLDKVDCRLVAEGAHDGLARAVTPPHMRSDGDAFVAAATGEIEAHVDHARVMAVIAVEQAARESVGSIEG